MDTMFEGEELKQIYDALREAQIPEDMVKYPLFKRLDDRYVLDITDFATLYFIFSEHRVNDHSVLKYKTANVEIKDTQMKINSSNLIYEDRDESIEAVLTLNLSDVTCPSLMTMEIKLFSSDYF